MAAMELWGVVEGGINKETPPGGVMADGQKYECRSFPKKIGVLESSTQHHGRRAQKVQVRKKNPP